MLEWDVEAWLTLLLIAFFLGESLRGSSTTLTSFSVFFGTIEADPLLSDFRPLTKLLLLTMAVGGSSAYFLTSFFNFSNVSVVNKTYWSVDSGWVFSESS